MKKKKMYRWLMACSNDATLLSAKSLWGLLLNAKEKNTNVPTNLVEFSHCVYLCIHAKVTVNEIHQILNNYENDWSKIAQHWFELYTMWLTRDEDNFQYLITKILGESYRIESDIQSMEDPE